MRTYILLTIIPLLLAAILLRGQVNPSADSCRIEITAPAGLDRVSDTGRVTGTVQKLAENTHIWVLVHRKGLALWWPQPPGDLKAGKGDWIANVYYGATEDVGSQFEIVALVVSADVNQRLRRWVDESAVSGRYPPIPLPVFVCQARKTVIRVR